MEKTAVTFGGVFSPKGYQLAKNTNSHLFSFSHVKLVFNSIVIRLVIKNIH